MKTISVTLGAFTSFKGQANKQLYHSKSHSKLLRKACHGLPGICWHSLCFITGTSFWSMCVWLRPTACAFPLAGARAWSRPAVMTDLAYQEEKSSSGLVSIPHTPLWSLCAQDFFFFSSWNFWFFFSSILPERALLEECRLSVEEFIKEISLPAFRVHFPAKFWLSTVSKTVLHFFLVLSYQLDFHSVWVGNGLSSVFSHG